MHAAEIRHQREGDRVFAPVHHALLGQQALDQGEGAVLRVGGRWQWLVDHSPSIGLDKNVG